MNIRWIRLAAIAAYLTVAACGGDDSEKHTAVIDDGVETLESAVGLIISADDSDSAKATAAKLESVTGEFAELSDRVSALDPPSSTQLVEIKNKLHTVWDPAMGKLNAASLAALDNQTIAPTLAPALQALATAVKETDSTLLGIRAD